MNNYISAIARRLTYAGVAMALVLGITTSTIGATPNTLQLAQSPLFIGSTATPNVMVAVDNSGTMDLETLFPTDTGMLYWDTGQRTGLLPEVVDGQLVTKLLTSTDDDVPPNFSTEEDGFNTSSNALGIDGNTGKTVLKKRLIPYGYLFPDGCNGGDNAGKRVYCGINVYQNGTLGLTIPALLGIPSPLNNPDINLFPLLLGDNSKVTISAVPPIPQFGYVRSPKYNKSYFNPKVTYDPWPNYKNAPITAAPSDPVAGNQTFDLTKDLKDNRKFWRFRVDAGMTIPQGTEISFGPLLDLGDNQLTELLNSLFTGIGGIVDDLLSGLCDLVGGLLGGLVHCPDVLDQIVGVLGGWHTMQDDWLVGEPLTRDLLNLDNCGGEVLGSVACNGTVTDLLNNLLLPLDLGIKYYPATVYLAANTPPPPGYDVTDAKAPLVGDGPDGSVSLRRYQIKPENFVSNTAYNKAIQNFANWFTYYRNRHLAVRAGLATALKESNGILNVGVEATNPASKSNAGPIVMRSTKDDLNGLYSDIYNINFSLPLGAPNRSALAYLGQQYGRQSDPIIAQSCQTNNAILFTDSYNTDGKNAVSVDNADGDGTEKGYEKGTLNSAFTDDSSNTIADIAMHYYLDLPKPDGIDDGQVPVPDACDAAKPPLRLDCNDNPHMVTSAVTLDERGLFYNNPPADQDPYNGSAPWKKSLDKFDPNQSGLAQIDDLWHATVNGRGKMLNVLTPAGIVDAFEKALEQSAVARGSATGVATQSRNLSADQKAFQTSFTSGDWHGELIARTVDNQTGQLSDNPIWTAASQLTDKSSDDRTILTTDAQGDAAAFSTESTNLGLSDKLIRYIRGDQSNEQANGGDLRNRGDNILSDIVHSTPLYVGVPDRLRYPVAWDDRLQDNEQVTPEDSAGSYHDFVTAQTGRKTMVYVGANDGMLHGFDADTGAEKLSYIPNAVFGNLAELADPNYSHRYYVDGSPVSGDVAFGGSWHTVLVGGLRGGGRGVYALDITHPDKFSERKPEDTGLWEYTNDDLGYVYGKPSIVRLHDGKWAALFGNGYNSKHRTTALFVVDTASGNCIAKLSTYGSSTSCNDQAGNDTDSGPHGLSEPFPVDLDGDFIADYAYAGDLHGNLWRFDLTNTNPSQWSVEKVFTATDSAGGPRPITSQPQVGTHPYGLDYGVMVYFGTGKYLERSDRTSSSKNTFYGIWDPNVFTATSVHDIPETASRDDLVAQSVTTEKPVATDDGTTSNTYRAVTDNRVDYQPDTDVTAGSYDRGWVLDLPGTGERVVTNAQLQEGERGENNTVAFSTLLPGDPEACGGAGNGFFMVLDQLNGGRPRTPVFDLNGDLSFTTADRKLSDDSGNNVGASGRKLGAGIPGAATHQTNQDSGDAYYIVPTSDGKTTTIPIPLLGKNGRVSWREIRR